MVTVMVIVGKCELLSAWMFGHKNKRPTTVAACPNHESSERPHGMTLRDENYTAKQLSIYRGIVL